MKKQRGERESEEMGFKVKLTGGQNGAVFDLVSVLIVFIFRLWVPIGPNIIKWAPLFLYFFF